MSSRGPSAPTIRERLCSATAPRRPPLHLLLLPPPLSGRAMRPAEASGERARERRQPAPARRAPVRDPDDHSHGGRDESWRVPGLGRRRPPPHTPPPPPPTPRLRPHPPPPPPP